MKRKQTLFLAVLILLVLAALLFWAANRPQAASGSKNVTLEVMHGDGREETFTLHTDAETLRQACVLTVDGETADESLQQWWCITKGGEEHFYGVDETIIQDGEAYEFTLKTGW